MPTMDGNAMNIVSTPTPPQSPSLRKTRRSDPQRREPSVETALMRMALTDRLSVSVDDDDSLGNISRKIRLQNLIKEDLLKMAPIEWYTARHGALWWARFVTLLNSLTTVHDRINFIMDVMHLLDFEARRIVDEPYLKLNQSKYRFFAQQVLRFVVSKDVGIRSFRHPIDHIIVLIHRYANEWVGPAFMAWLCLESIDRKMLSQFRSRRLTRIVDYIQAWTLFDTNSITDVLALIHVVQRLCIRHLNFKANLIVDRAIYNRLKSIIQPYTVPVNAGAYDASTTANALSLMSKLCNPFMFLTGDVDLSSSINTEAFPFQHPLEYNRCIEHVNGNDENTTHNTGQKRQRSPSPSVATIRKRLRSDNRTVTRSPQLMIAKRLFSYQRWSLSSEKPRNFATKPVWGLHPMECDASAAVHYYRTLGSD